MAENKWVAGVITQLAEYKWVYNYIYNPIYYILQPHL